MPTVSAVLNSGQFTKGFIPWNKGVKLSKAHIRNLSIAHMGHKTSKESIQKRVAKCSGPNHWLWKGENVGYYALHSWVKRTFGAPDKCENSLCKYPRLNKRGRLMKKPARYEWANKGTYTRERQNWLMLCPSCHRQMDYGTR